MYIDLFLLIYMYLPHVLTKQNLYSLKYLISIFLLAILSVYNFYWWISANIKTLNRWVNYLINISFRFLTAISLNVVRIWKTKSGPSYKSFRKSDTCKISHKILNVHFFCSLTQLSLPSFSLSLDSIKHGLTSCRVSWNHIIYKFQSFFPKN